jgi:Resolvase, N terminal domain
MLGSPRTPVENQIRELRQVAERRGWEVIGVYNDAGISGAKGRNGRPGLDSMLKDASRRRFDVVMAWAIDRLGRSLTDLLHIIQHLEACGVDLYLDQQSIDTTEARQRDRTEGTKATCQGNGDLENRQALGPRDWHRAAHQPRASRPAMMMGRGQRAAARSEQSARPQQSPTLWWMLCRITASAISTCRRRQIGFGVSYPNARRPRPRNAAQSKPRGVTMPIPIVSLPPP